jgi:putative sigma-54 modulation protein
MKIEYTARRVKLSPKVREIVEKKFIKLSKVLPADAQAHVIVHAEKKGVTVEVNVVGRQRTWTAAEIGGDQETATHAVLERIEAQAKKTKQKVKEEKKHTSAGVRSPEVWAPAAVPGDGPVERRMGPEAEQVKARPMFEEDALTQFTARDKDVLVFRDPSSDALRVLYRRRDGSLGLLIPS